MFKEQMFYISYNIQIHCAFSLIFFKYGCFIPFNVGRFYTKNLGYFHVIFHSVVMKVCVILISYSTTIKAKYPLVVLREMSFSNEIDTKMVHDLEGFSAFRTAYDIFASFPQKRTKSLLLTIASYYLPIVLSITTKHTFIPFCVWSPNWKMLQNFVCRTGHFLTESPCTVLIMLVYLPRQLSSCPSHSPWCTTVGTVHMTA